MANASPAPVPSAGPGVGLTPLLAALVLVGAALLAYHNTFQVPFLFDDNSSIRDNPSIRSLASAWLPPPTGGLTVSGRPLLNFTLAVNYAVSGTEVWSYHAVNLLIHALAGCVLFGIVRRTLLRPPCRSLLARSTSSGPRASRGAGDARVPTNASGAESPASRLLQKTVETRVSAFRDESPASRLLQPDACGLALAVALLWTLHPLQTEAVTYLVQRAESLVGLLYLLTLWCFIRSVEPEAPPRWRWFAFVACLGGMATKEVMVTAPVMVALYDRVFLATSWREVWEKRGRRHLALAGTWLVLGALVLATGTRGGTAGWGTSVAPLAYALTQIGVVADYLRLAFWPQPLIFDYGQFLVGGAGEVLLPALLVLPLLAMSLYALGRGQPAGYAGVFFFAVLAPTSSLVPVVTQTMNEHRMYLPLAAVAVLFVTAVYSRLGRWSFALFFVGALALGGATVRRNLAYRTELTLWEDTVAKRPASARALAALGAIHQREGRLDAALAALQAAVRVAPASAEAHNNLGNVWMKLGRWAEAAECFQAALARAPAEPFALNNLGNAYLQLGRGSEALVQLAAAVRAKPDLHEARFNLANTLAQAGRLDEAATHFAILLAARPDDAEARSNFGEVLRQLGRAPEGLAQLEAAVRLKPGSAVLHNNLGGALAEAGRPAEALAQFREAVRLDPNFKQARENAERAARQIGGH